MRRKGQQFFLVVLRYQFRSCLSVYKGSEFREVEILFFDMCVFSVGGGFLFIVICMFQVLRYVCWLQEFFVFLLGVWGFLSRIFSVQICFFVLFCDKEVLCNINCIKYFSFFQEGFVCLCCFFVLFGKFIFDGEVGWYFWDFVIFYDCIWMKVCGVLFGFSLDWR